VIVHVHDQHLLLVVIVYVCMVMLMVYCVWSQALSQDLLSATLEIPFSVPPYMSLLARSVATLEGIALVGDPNYQMVAQVHDGSGGRSHLV
jgi:hypothetical protein